MKIIKNINENNKNINKNNTSALLARIVLAIPEGGSLCGRALNQCLCVYIYRLLAPLNFNAKLLLDLIYFFK